MNEVSADTSGAVAVARGVLWVQAALWGALFFLQAQGHVVLLAVRFQDPTFSGGVLSEAVAVLLWAGGVLAALGSLAVAVLATMLAIQFRPDHPAVRLNAVRLEVGVAVFSLVMVAFTFLTHLFVQNVGGTFAMRAEEGAAEFAGSFQFVVLAAMALAGLVALLRQSARQYFGG